MITTTSSTWVGGTLCACYFVSLTGPVVQRLADWLTLLALLCSQKTFEPAPGNKTASDSLILFTSSVLTEHGGEHDARFAETFERNTIVFMPGKYSYGKVDKASQLGTVLLLNNNSFYTDGADITLTVGSKANNLTELQALGAEQASTITTQLPTDAQMVSWAKVLLLMGTDIDSEAHK